MGFFIICLILLIFIGYAAYNYNNQKYSETLKYLERLLANQEWFQANITTNALLHRVAFDKFSTYKIDSHGERMSEVYFRHKPENIKRFPCHILNQVDQLWIKYSNGHFGLSIQKKCYDESVQKLLVMSQDKKQELIREIRSNCDEFEFIIPLKNAYTNNNDKVRHMNDRELSPEFFFFYQMGWIITFTCYSYLEYHDGLKRRIRSLAGLTRLNYTLNAPQGHLPYIVKEGLSNKDRETILQIMSKIARNYSNYNPPVNDSETIGNPDIDVTIAFLERLESCKR